MWFIRVNKITDLTGECPRRPYDIILSHNTPDVNMRSHLDIFNSLHQNINCTSITKEDNIISQQSLSMHYNLLPPMITNHYVSLCCVLPPSDQSHVKSTLTPFWAALSRCRHWSGARLQSHDWPPDCNYRSFNQEKKRQLVHPWQWPEYNICLKKTQ